MASFKSKEVISILQKLGFVEKRQTGSHKMMYHFGKNKIIPIPIHNRDIKKGLMKSIIKQAESTEKEFLQLK
ncbi:MAG: type II toxin-antitoxin system HicA family toxin [Candidatus Daviesbacteria bacterium]|nr:type II toxin-antitoxin system HicA family toxin [Candidatus Daviesbacteria bacterium]